MSQTVYPAPSQKAHDLRDNLSHKISENACTACRLALGKTTAIKPFDILKCQAWLAQKVSDIMHV